MTLYYDTHLNLFNKKCLRLDVITDLIVMAAAQCPLYKRTTSNSYVTQTCNSEADFLEEQLERLCSWKAVLESVKQRAESTNQTSGSDEFHIFILNAKSELENAIKSKPERGRQRQRERESEEDLRVSFNRQCFLNMLNRNCGEVLQQVFEDRSSP